MPAVTGSPAFNSLDIQDQMIAYLNADVYIQSFLKNSTGGQNLVVDDDPTPGSVDQATSTRLVFTLAKKGSADATMGREHGGTAAQRRRFAVILYLYEGDNRVSATKRSLIQFTDIIEMALLRYGQGQGVPAGATTSTQLWFSTDFPEDAQSFYTASPVRFSTTIVNLYSRIPIN